MSLSVIEDEVLGRCADDYEAPHTVAGDIARDLGRPISEAEVREAFVSLALAGLVQAFVFEASSSRYVPISANEAARRDAAWFMINPAGRKLCENEAS